MSGWITGIPLYGGEFQGVYNCLNNTYEVSISNTDLNGYNAYLGSLASNGFAKYTGNTIGSNLFATYKNQTTAVYTCFYPNTSVCKIIVEPLSYLPATSAGTYKKVVQSSITQIGRTDLVNTDNGMSYIIQLDDGSFILIDGGNQNRTDEENLYNFLVNRISGGKEPVIAAWFFTHAHPDHMDLPIQFMKEYKNKVKIELFVYNFPDLSNAGSCKDITGPDQYKTIVQGIENDIKNYFPYSKVCKVHTGEKFYLRNAVIDTLYTHEDLFPQALTFVNESSLAFRINVDGTKIMILGDCEVPCNKLMVKEYGSEMKSDILQPAHHGYNCGTLQLYQLINPSVCLWACSDKAFNSNAVRKYDYNMYLISNPNVKQYTSSYTTTISLPYNP